MNGNYSDESQEGAGSKEKDDYKPPVIDEVSQANKLFNMAVEDMRARERLKRIG